MITDPQLMAVAIPTIILLSLPLRRNRRLEEFKQSFRDDMGQFRSDLEDRFAQCMARMDARFDSLERKLDDGIDRLGRGVEKPPR